MTKSVSSNQTPEQVLRLLFDCYHTEGLHEAETQLTELMVTALLPDTYNHADADHAEAQAKWALIMHLRQVLRFTRLHFQS